MWTNKGVNCLLGAINKKNDVKDNTNFENGVISY